MVNGASPSTANNYDLWGIGIMHKFLHDSSAGTTSWDPGPLASDSPDFDYRTGYLKADGSGQVDRIFGDSKVLLRMDTGSAGSTVHNSGARDIFIFGTVSSISTGAKDTTINFST